jgi:hypothetical protein
MIDGNDEASAIQDRLTAHQATSAFISDATMLPHVGYVLDDCFVAYFIYLQINYRGDK